jgi:hypothetical protein
MGNFKAENEAEDQIRKYKRGYFVEWRICDQHKKEIFNRINYYLDTNIKNMPKIITGHAYKTGLKEAVSKPFRAVPYFDEGLWGGRWLEKVCGVNDVRMRNYAWC